MNYSNNSSNYAGLGNALGAQASATPQPGILANIESALENALNNIHANTADLSGIADRVLGTQPEPVAGKGEPTPANPPQLRRIADLSERLLNATGDLGNQVTRLHRL
jgi:hypothetical protein